MIDPEELLNRLYKRAKEGYYEDKPPYQFSKDELDLMYYLGSVDEISYQNRKQILEQKINDYYCIKKKSFIYNINNSNLHNITDIKEN